MLVLDTDHISAMEWQTEVAQGLRTRLKQSGRKRVTTVVTYEEQSRGWLAYIARANTIPQLIDAYSRLSKQLKQYLRMPVLEFDQAAAAEYAALRRTKLRNHVGPLDLRIAAIVLAHDATLLSRNLKDFEQVPGLKVENWLD